MPRGGRRSSTKQASESQTSFSFTVSTGSIPAGGGDELGFDWSVLRKWAGGPDGLSVTSQARMLFEAEKKEVMPLSEAYSKFIVIRRLLEDELKRLQS